MYPLLPPCYLHKPYANEFNDDGDDVDGDDDNHAKTTGGTFLVGVIVLGQTPSWMSSFTAWPALAVSWWLTFFSPQDLWHRHVMRQKAVIFLIGFGSALSASHAVTSWGADKVRER